MTPGEEKLRYALEEINKRAKDSPGLDELGLGNIAGKALNQADEINGRPSEEDKEELEGIIYTLDTDGVCGRHDARWMADKLKPLMGIK